MDQFLEKTKKKKKKKKIFYNYLLETEVVLNAYIVPSLNSV